MARILVTGSAGLIGSAVCEELARMNWDVRRLDLLENAPGDGFGDIRDPLALARRIVGCTGVLHLAAVSRVAWGQKNPVLCDQTNIGGTKNVVEAAAKAAARPWVLFSSSREAYGEPEKLPVHEDDPLLGSNVYGSSKIKGEKLVRQAREMGLNTSIIRFSNVYGATTDHPDRVTPAFARAGAFGDPMRIDGRGHTFDFVHLDDTVKGVVVLMQMLEAGERNLPPVHLVTGKATTLGELAELARAAGGGLSEMHEAPEHDYDVSRFVGDPSRAKDLLGWQAETGIEEGVQRLVDDFKREGRAQSRV